MKRCDIKKQKEFQFSKRAQMKISFGMIFSIFLIISFLAFSFYAIKNFVNIGKESQIKQFVSSLQNDVDKMWKSSKGSQEESYSLPEKIEKICFKDDEFENLIFVSKEFIAPEKILHLDLEKITSEENPYCIDNTEGKVNLIIKKNFGENEVTIIKK